MLGGELVGKKGVIGVDGIGLRLGAGEGCYLGEGGRSHDPHIEALGVRHLQIGGPKSGRVYALVIDAQSCLLIM